MPEKTEQIENQCIFLDSLEKQFCTASLLPKKEEAVEITKSQSALLTLTQCRGTKLQLAQVNVHVDKVLETEHREACKGEAVSPAVWRQSTPDDTV